MIVYSILLFKTILKGIIPIHQEMYYHKIITKLLLYIESSLILNFTFNIILIKRNTLYADYLLVNQYL